MKKYICIGLAIAAIIGIVIFRQEAGIFKKHSEPAAVRRDTVIVRDTVYPPVPQPEIIRVVAFDTVRVIDGTGNHTDSIPKILPDSTVAIPISTAVYETDDYKAVIEGYRPRLASIELYPKVTTITNTIVVTGQPRWAITGGVGIGYIPGKGIEPYIGVSAGYVFWSK